MAAVDHRWIKGWMFYLYIWILEGISRRQETDHYRVDAHEHIWLVKMTARVHNLRAQTHEGGLSAAYLYFKSFSLPGLKCTLWQVLYWNTKSLGFPPEGLNFYFREDFNEQILISRCLFMKMGLLVALQWCTSRVHFYTILIHCWLCAPF